MQASRLTRRASLLVPFLLAACGHKERTDFLPLRYNYLPPIRLNVAAISIEQRFYPSGIAPDITALAPVHPAEALRTMAEDRLQADGSTGQAVFGITNASLTRRDDVISCALSATLEIYPTPGIRSGFAEAVVSRQLTGSVDDLRSALYDIVRATMDAMNVEFEYQVRSNLQPWLVSNSAVPSPVQQQPLVTSPADQDPDAPQLQPGSPAMPPPSAPAPMPAPGMPQMAPSDMPQMSPPPMPLMPPSGLYPPR